jgi:phosphomannomutase
MPGTLREQLRYEPQPLQFGTSGRRGEVIHLTQLEVYINALGELEFLLSLPVGQGGIRPEDEFYFAADLRPSSTAYVPEMGGRGELAQAIERAIRDAGLRPVWLGRIPTPALAAYALARGRGSMMVTGSHIPFDRNGYKTNTSRGELLKSHEAPVNAGVERVRARLYAQPFAQAAFDEDGRLRSGSAALPAEVSAGRAEYVARYLDFFGPDSLAGVRLMAYQHSAVGRDLLVEVLRGLGAETIAAGRSETFVPIDTENVDAAQLAAIEGLLAEVREEHADVDAVVSTDGDSDRPLILGVDAATGKARFFPGDLVGMVVAEFLGADAVVVPISTNDAIDRGMLAPVLEPKTRIGSPYVIAGMEGARAKGRKAVCGWEANGGFLIGSDIERKGRTLAALPTRDAMLPVVAALLAARERGASLAEVFDALPRRFSRAALLRNFPRAKALRILEQFHGGTAEARRRLEAFFDCGPVERLDYTDGTRAIFVNGEVAHLRPSGNADEFRIYAVADSQQRADEVCARAVAEPDGVLRRMERSLR